MADYYAQWREVAKSLEKGAIDAEGGLEWMIAKPRLQAFTSLWILHAIYNRIIKPEDILELPIPAC
jgi:hypothetical protein